VVRGRRNEEQGTKGGGKNWKVEADNLRKKPKL
jgi:hypothetical protein